MPEQHPAGSTILLIDDEDNTRKLGKLLLERAGYRVLTASSGEAGLLLAKVEQPDVILLDVLMPKMNGHEALRKLKADPDTAKTPVIMLTGKRTDHDIAASFRFGAVFHLEKPYETTELLRRIKMALALTSEQANGAPDAENGGQNVH